MLYKYFLIVRILTATTQRISNIEGWFKHIEKSNQQVMLKYLINNKLT